MLTELHVENLGVIERLTLLLDPAMTALTGETGAGKTLVVEAIDLLMGGRADPVLVRPGAVEARVEGRFVLPAGVGAGALGALASAEIVLTRVVPAEGRSRAYVDGRPATVATLAEYGAGLVDLHGQHAHQSLLAASSQRQALDRFAGIDLTPLTEARRAVGAIDTALAALGGDERARAREIDLLRFQLDDLDRAAIVGPDEDTELARAADLLATATIQREHGEQANTAISDEGGAVDLIRTALASLTGRPVYESVAARLRSLAVELDDTTADLRAITDSIEQDPTRLAAINARRKVLADLRRKYGDTLDEVIAEHGRLAERYDELTSHETRAAELERQRAEATSAVTSVARKVAKARRAGAPKLADAVATHLHALGLGHARIDINVAGDESGDEVRFLFAANPGEPPLPLSKIASGGELARTMLALRLVLTAGPETLVFDEVDAGIGGEAAIAVGKALAELGRDHQVLVVTHLAQVAARADSQVVVTKQVLAGRTISDAHVVAGDARVEELSRMLSGRSTAASKAHALELLS
jgi:DNA repair protein RecN (Recombination protein N)